MNATLKTTFQNFARTVAPYLHIQDQNHYEDVLVLIEELMQDAQDTVDSPDNPTIEMLSAAIANYERNNSKIADFDAEAKNMDADVAMLRLIMSQHKLGVADFPEIGDKSLVSRILSGSRNLTKQHIQKLSARFNINPGMFF